MYDELVNKYPNNILSQKVKKNFPDLHKLILNSTIEYKLISFKERLFIHFKKENPFCSKGFKKKFNGIEYKFCGNPAKCICHKNASIARFKTFDRTKIQKKIEENNLKKYGVHNPMLVDEFKNKRYDTISNRTYPKRKPSIKEYNRIIKRLKGIVTPNFDKSEYKGVTKQYYEWKCDNCYYIFVDNVNNGRTPKCPVCFPKEQSIGEIEIIDFLSKMGIHYTTRRIDIIPPYEIDIFLDNYKLAIEYNGTYWHSEEKGKGKFYHQNKILLAKDKGITLIHIWEHDWKNKKPVMKKIIKDIIENNIDFRYYAEYFCDLIPYDLFSFLIDYVPEPKRIIVDGLNIWTSGEIILNSRLTE